MGDPEGHWPVTGWEPVHEDLHDGVQDHETGQQTDATEPEVPCLKCPLRDEDFPQEPSEWRNPCKGQCGNEEHPTEQWMKRDESADVLIRFDNGYTMYSHNQLYGRWYVKQAYEYPKTNRQLRVAIHNEKKSALLYSASDIEVMRDEEVHLHPFIARVGPDILSEDVTSGDILTRMEAFRRRKWAHLLLDQGFVAGIGNYLRSEILFVSGIHPTLRPMDCRDDQLTLAAEAIIHLMKQSYETAWLDFFFKFPLQVPKG